jgi:hypothetical protein
MIVVVVMNKNIIWLMKEVSLKKLVEIDSLGQGGVRILFQESISTPIKNLFSILPDYDITQGDFLNENWMQEHEQLNERLTKIGQDQKQEIIKIMLDEIENSKAINITLEIKISDGQISLNNSLYIISMLIDTIIEFGRGKERSGRWCGGEDLLNPYHPSFTWTFIRLPTPLPPLPILQINTHFFRMANPRLLILEGRRPFFGMFLEFGQSIGDAIFVQKISNFWWTCDLVLASRRNNFYKIPISGLGIMPQKQNYFELWAASGNQKTFYFKTFFGWIFFHKFLTKFFYISSTWKSSKIH